VDAQGPRVIPFEPSLKKTPPEESGRLRAPRADLGEVQVSVCIVNHNNRELLSKCIDSVEAQAGDVSFEVLVADNGSTDDSVAWLKREHPTVRLFEHENIGFSRANNRLIRQARGSMILLLNNDCILEKRSLRKLVEPMDGDPRMGVLGCRIVTGEGILQPTFLATSLSHFLFPNPMEIYRAHLLTFGKNLEKRQQAVRAYESRHGYDRFCEVESVCGVCILIRRELLDAIGLLDERFFMYYEDADLCLRARAAGWKVGYTPAVCAHHYVRRKQDKGSGRLVAEARFSQYYFIEKHYGQPWAALMALRYFVQLVLTVFPLGVLSALRRMDFRGYLTEINSQWQTLSRILVSDFRSVKGHMHASGSNTRTQ